MMSREEMKIRLGFYMGRAIADLGDLTYFERWYGKNFTEAEYSQITSEIHARLLAAGTIQPDEDPAEEILREFLS